MADTPFIRAFADLRPIAEKYFDSLLSITSAIITCSTAEHGECEKCPTRKIVTIVAMPKASKPARSPTLASSESITRLNIDATFSDKEDARTPTEKPALSGGTKVPIGGWSFLLLALLSSPLYSAYIFDGQLQEIAQQYAVGPKGVVGMIHHADIEFSEGSKGKFGVILRNSGKTPAFSLETLMFVEFVPQDSLPQFTGFRCPAGDGAILRFDRFLPSPLTKYRP